MDEQGGAGGVPLKDDEEQARHRKPHVRDEGKTAAADTDEASRLDRPQQPEKPRESGKGREKGNGIRWVSPRDE